jgi:hypothetical protein
VPSSSYERRYNDTYHVGEPSTSAAISEHGLSSSSLAVASDLHTNGFQTERIMLRMNISMSLALYRTKCYMNENFLRQVPLQNL